jgi:fatty-acyl-CoA synthase
VESTMQDFPLTIPHILRHGQKIHHRSQVATFDGAGVRRASFGQVAERAEQLAAGLRRLGIGEGDRVATFCWNHQEHLEAYLAIPSMGAVMHTLNIRLFPEQLTFVANHGEDRVVIVDDSLVPVLARVADQLKTVEHFIVVGGGDATPLGEVLRYDEVLAAEQPGFSWPNLDERSAAAMCYTSGTTGDPKGVVYSHRSTFLHSMSVNTVSVLGISESDKLLVIVPMFHANAWGTPYAGWMAGADFVMPQRFLQAEPLTRLIALERPTLSAGVPTIWNDILQYSRDHDIDLSSLRMVTAGGSAVPRNLLEQFQDRFGVRMFQGWGMTETSPVCALAYPPKDTDAAEDLDWRAKTGRVIPGVEVRIVAEDGTVAPNDGASLGEIEVRGPWITGSYYRDPAPEKFDEGWLRTGDIASMDDYGFLQIADRTKDVIKSGGEWISSVELENVLMSHTDIVEASVVGVPDDRWDERPLASVVLRPGATVSAEELRAWLGSRVAKWWLPERWAFVDEIPKTSVGKFDKKTLRSRYQTGDLDVVTLGGSGEK